jgi:hypothetical protein
MQRVRVSSVGPGVSGLGSSKRKRVAGGAFFSLSNVDHRSRVLPPYFFGRFLACIVLYKYRSITDIPLYPINFTGSTRAVRLDWEGSHCSEAIGQSTL